jgi:hypothetical protein
MHGKPKPALRALTLTYVVALLALAALAIASFFIPQREYRNQQTGDAVLRAASRQEALSERVSFLAYRVATARDPSERRRCREKLSSTVNEMEASHRALLKGDPESRMPSTLPASVRAIYFGPPFFLDQQLSRYFADARGIINAPDAELDKSNPHLVAIRNAAEGDLPGTLGSGHCRSVSRGTLQSARVRAHQPFHLCTGQRWRSDGGVAAAIKDAVPVLPNARRVSFCLQP